jgi:hypothetical protein
MIAKVNVRAIRRNALWMVVQSSARLVSLVVMANAVSKAAVILLREVSDLGARV